jgi:IS5 family transposase
VRSTRDTQGSLFHQRSTLKVTDDFQKKYIAISDILDANPAILELVAADLAAVVASENTAAEREGRKGKYTAENAFRGVLLHFLEGESLRRTVVLIDISPFLQWFTRINHGPTMDFTTLDRFKNAIDLETWTEVNRLLGAYALAEGKITGEQLRVDTTAFETNIHYPTDSSLLFDTYRVLARIVDRIRQVDPELVGNRRLQLSKAKADHVWLARHASRKGTSNPSVQKRYSALISRVEAILAWCAEIAERLKTAKNSKQSSVAASLVGSPLIRQMKEVRELGGRVVSQTRRRVLEGEQVPAAEKIYSIFEPHTELLKRGKAGKPIEFGHMVFLQQTAEKFITEFETFEKRPVEYNLIDPALERHKRLFGQLPSVLAADKASYESVEKLKELERKIPLVAIAKLGSKTEDQKKRESSLPFKLGQAFRAGIEGSISFLKRALRMCRCFYKGWKHYRAAVGAIVVAHNLLILARGGGSLAH